eukprot:Nitzschia sp. Nitz4//scaffold51_size120721//53796//55076//NITZ4_003727-RA/size120721-processed-gene-0.151-mRNA-1//-1//CDS//3329553862//7869//frame0
MERIFEPVCYTLRLSRGQLAYHEISEDDADKYQRIIFVGAGFEADIMAHGVELLRSNRNSLQELVLQECSGRTDLLFAELPSLSRLESLSLRWYSYAFHPSWANGLQESLARTPTLKELVLEGGNMHSPKLWLSLDIASSLADGLKMNDSLQKLVLKRVVFEGTKATSLLLEGVSANKSLKAVELGRCWSQMDTSLDDGTRTMQNVLDTLCKDEKKLAFDFDVSLDTETLSVISSVLPQLRHLKLHGANQNMDLNLLESTLALAPRLHQLDLVRIGLPEWFAQVLAAALACSTCSIRAIGIFGAGEIVLGEMALAERLHEMKGLVELKITDCFGLTGHRLGQGLKHNYSLEILDVNGMRGPFYYLDLNWAGRGKLQRIDSSCLSLWPYILARTQALVSRAEGPRRQAQTIYFLLQQYGPMIFNNVE